MKAMYHFVENITKKESCGISFDVLALSGFSPVGKAKPALAQYLNPHSNFSLVPSLNLHNHFSPGNSLGYFNGKRELQ